MKFNSKKYLLTIIKEKTEHTYIKWGGAKELKMKGHLLLMELNSSSPLVFQSAGSHAALLPVDDLHVCCW